MYLRRLSAHWNAEQKSVWRHSAKDAREDAREVDSDDEERLFEAQAHLKIMIVNPILNTDSSGRTMSSRIPSPR